MQTPRRRLPNNILIPPPQLPMMRRFVNFWRIRSTEKSELRLSVLICSRFTAASGEISNLFPHALWAKSATGMMFRVILMVT
jgi:hypothetical protein